MKNKKVAILFSGGKDSCLALHLAKQKNYDIKYLLTIIPKNFDSFMFHKPNLKLLKKQAQMLNLKLITQKTKGEKEKELKDLEKLILKIKKHINTIVIGGIVSSYQEKRIKKICDKLKLNIYPPLKNFKEKQIWDLLLKKNFKVILTKITCEGLEKNWLGKIIDNKTIKDLKKLSKKYKFRIDFEGGEAETAVLYMPGFKKQIKIKYNIKSEGKYRHWLDIKEVK